MRTTQVILTVLLLVSRFALAAAAADAPFAVEPDGPNAVYTWIDLGVPDHGSWKRSEWGVPADFYERRLENLRQFAARTDDVEWMPEDEAPVPTFVAPRAESEAAASENRSRNREISEGSAAQPARILTNPDTEGPAAVAAPACPGWPFDAAEAQRRQQAVGLPATLSLKLDEKLTLELVLVPPGEFVLGDAAGRANERPATRVHIDRPFYLGRTEVTNAQYRAIADGTHHSGFVSWMSIDWRGEGHPLNGPDQPVARVSWDEADRFCQALAARIGRRVILPTEVQWEWAARAGTAGWAWYGGRDDDFSAFENLAGGELRTLAFSGKPKWFLRDDRFQDAWAVTAPAGATQPNPWGLCDMLGNVREWTRSTYRPNPIDPATDVPGTDPADEKTVRGGAWSSRPSDAGSAWRWKYPAWRRVHDVGFRVAVEVDSQAVDKSSSHKD